MSTQFLQDYYGRRLKTKADLVEKACCAPETESEHKEIFRLLPREVTEKHYGCGVPIPKDDLTGLNVLDLGSGSGVDVFIMAHKVGPSGFVYGVDMTREQVDVATKNISAVMANFRFPKSNVAFYENFIETAEAIPDASVDLVISDCVINLSPRKDLVFKTIFRVLKPGGEFYISDIASDRRLPDAFKNDPVLVAECFGGAEYVHDWFDQMKEAGFKDPREVERKFIQKELRGVPVTFWSLTVRGFKTEPPLDNRCEDYGQTALYKGNLKTSPAEFILDDHHVFEAHRPMPVCQNTARMLQESRLSNYFEVTAPLRHFGLFPCGPAKTPNTNQSSAASCC